jgi:hypothetical protein
MAGGVGETLTTSMPWNARLHVVTLSSFAIAQPLYDLIGRNPEFLVAHGAAAWTIAMLIAMLSLGIPLVLIAAADALTLFSPHAGAALQRGIVAGLAGLVTAGALRDAQPALALSIVALTVAIAAFAYRLAAVRAFLTVASIAVPIFPLVFVLGTPVARIVWPAAKARVSDAAPGLRPPIVVVVFDELGTFPLLDEKGEIDAQRLPNFASLARRATWFPNAVAAFPYTEQALPAIVTGVDTDRAERRLMIAEEYPNNLFTWLGTSYPLHVLEPLSRLCPAPLCTAKPTTDARGLLLDVAVLYSHLVTPRTLAESRLPSLEFKWKDLAGEPGGETTGGSHDEVSRDGVNMAREVGRGELFRRFIQEIEPGTVLHFVHVLLPHDPYVYLPSGRRYTRGELAVGMSNGGVWLNDPALIATGLRQHVAQLGFADRLLGELIARLDAEGLFDPALIIVTSDHGSAFVGGQPHRTYTAANYREVIATPIFVKLPHQEGGRVDTRRASALDVVPTIADVLDVAVPWRTDGRSVLGGGFPERTTLTYAGSGVGPLPAFDVRMEAHTLRARARTEAGPENRLIGTRVTDHEVRQNAPGMQVLSESFLSLQSVAPNRAFVPVLITGRVEQEPPAIGPLPLAIAVNGVVHSVTRTTTAYGAAHYFAAIVPEAAIHAGANVLEVFAIEETLPAVRLARMSSDLGGGLTIARGPNGETLSTRDGRSIPISPHVIGVIDRIEAKRGTVDFQGWALDRRGPGEVRTIVAFSGNTSIACAYPAEPRPDVAAALRAPASTRVSYVLSVERQDLERRAIRLFGMSRDGLAGELQVSSEARQVLARLWETSARRN